MKQSTNWNEHPSAMGEYFKGDDVVDDNTFTLTIKAVSERELKNPSDGKIEKKICLEFEQDGRYLTMNKTRGNTMAKLFGQNYRKWPGNYVTLFGVDTPMGPGVRIRKATNKPKPGIISQFGDENEDADESTKVEKPTVKRVRTILERKSDFEDDSDL